MSTTLVHDTSASRPNRVYRPELDAVRFLAFLMVFFSHAIDREGIISLAHPLNSLGVIVADMGNFGLSLFFTLSAFLICDLLMREREIAGRVDILAFYKRRTLRIWPLYLLALAIGAAWAIRNHQPYFHYLAACLLISGNWYFYRNGFFPNPMITMWSISVEEQFYLFWPIVASKGSRRVIFLICAGFVIIANCFLVLYGRNHTLSDVVPWSNTFVQFQMFVVGIVMALLLKHKSPEFNLPIRIILVAGAIFAWALAICAAHIKNLGQAPSATQYVCGYALVGAGCGAIIIACLGIQRVPGFMVGLGKISYGLYVFHYLMLKVCGSHIKNKAVVAIAALAFTIIIAKISYKWFESPFLRLKKRSEVIQSRPI